MRVFGSRQNIFATLLRASGLICATALLLSADTLTLRNGTTVQGTYLGGTSRQVRMDQNGDVRTYDIGQVQSVIFSESDYQPPAPPPPPRAPAPKNATTALISRSVIPGTGRICPPPLVTMV